MIITLSIHSTNDVSDWPKDLQKERVLGPWSDSLHILCRSDSNRQSELSNGIVIEHLRETTSPWEGMEQNSVSFANLECMSSFVTVSVSDPFLIKASKHFASLAGLANSNDRYTR